MAIYQLGDLVPDVHPSAYVAETATVIGRVKLEANTTVWSNVTIRGDNDQITIGENSNIQESAVLHTDPGYLLTLGRGVTVGPNPGARASANLRVRAFLRDRLAR